MPHSSFLAWSDEDRAKALSYVVENGLRCVMCGTAQWEWDENRFAYEALETTCQGCYIKEQVSRDSERNPGVTVELRPTGTREAAQRRVTARNKARRRAKERSS